MIGSVEQQRLVDFLDSGKAVYVEGVDFGSDHYYTELFSYFGCNYLGDGFTNNVQYLMGLSGTFTAGLQFSYQYGADTDYLVDQIDENEGTLFFVSQDGIGRGVCYDGEDQYRTIFTSTLFGAMIEGPEISTKAYLMENYLNYLFPPINAIFYADVTSGFDPLTVNFFDLSEATVLPIISWQWDFENDGVIDSYEQNPTHIYQEPGTYTVSLTVSTFGNVYTDTEIKQDYIYVESSANIDDSQFGESEFILHQNYPNPFNSFTKISFSSVNSHPEHQPKILIYNVKGDLVKEFDNIQMNQNIGEVIWDGKDNNGIKVADGIYFYQFDDIDSKIKQMVILR